MAEWHYASLMEAADAIRSQQITSTELTRLQLDRIKKLEPSLRSYATVTTELALEQARIADQEILAGRHRGPLHGVPVAVKDLCDTAGIVTAAGMSIRKTHIPKTDATVVRKLVGAGAVLLGKAQLTEGAFATHHPTVPRPVNPWNDAYYAGASSSGSGVAVAAGLCYGALGSDTGGSIRFPCSATGITGLKPTWGRVSRHGVFPLAPTLDHIGPMARSAVDAGAMLGAIAGLDPKDPTSLTAPVPDYLANLDKGIRGIRVGVDASYNEPECDTEIIAAVREVQRVLQNHGAVVKQVKVPNPAAVAQAWGSIASAEVALVHEATYSTRTSEYGRLSNLIEAGRAVSRQDLLGAHYERLAFAGALAVLFQEIDLLLIPTQPRANFTIAQEEELFSTPEGLVRFLRFATPFDMSGSPTITLPGGFTAKGMPLSFQLVARHLDEELLVRAGHAYQQATDWHRKHPWCEGGTPPIP
jgi:amidase